MAPFRTCTHLCLCKLSREVRKSTYIMSFTAIGICRSCAHQTGPSGGKSGRREEGSIQEVLARSEKIDPGANLPKMRFCMGDFTFLVQPSKPSTSAACPQPANSGYPV